MYLLLLAADVPASPPELPEFEFREHRAGSQYNMSAKGLQGCDRTVDGVICSRQSQIAGTWAVLQFQLASNRLANLTVTGNRTSITTVIPSLKAKYGEPCASETRKVQNRLGAEFSSLHLKWCFKSGSLTFNERSYRYDMYQVRYIDNNAVPREKSATVDF